MRPSVQAAAGEPEALSASIRVGVARFAMMSDQSRRKGERNGEGFRPQSQRRPQHRCDSDQQAGEAEIVIKQVIDRIRQ